MSNLPWFPFYLNDWETDAKVRLMGPVTRSFFLVFLMHQWREGAIPADRKILRLLLLMPSDPTVTREQAGSRLEDFVDYDAVLDQVLQCFTPNENGGLINARLESIRAGCDQKRKKSSIGGQRGGRAKSEAKTKAVRENGEQGGRPTQKSLGFDPLQAPENTGEKNQNHARARQNHSQSQNQSYNEPEIASLTPVPHGPAEISEAPSAEKAKPASELNRPPAVAWEDSAIPCDEWVSKIGPEHPKLSHLKGLNLPCDVQQAIAAAIVRHGPEQVLRGTLKLRDAVERWPSGERRFAPNPVKFYSQSEYLKEPEDRTPRSKSDDATDRFHNYFDGEADLVRTRLARA
jgi:uncharacterized protein YdaU (DUF1376 family)